MARKIQWTKEKYALALRGDTLPGLRRVVRGFTAKDGYDIRSFDTWSNSQKRRIQKYYGYVHDLEAQERRIIYPRNNKIKKTLTDAFHGDIPSKMFKAVFMPYTAPKGLPGAKSKPPKIKISKTGQIVTDVETYKRIFTPFNQVALAVDPETEVARAFNAAPDAKLFYVQTGQYQSVNAKSKNLMVNQVLKWMAQYDGVKQLPSGSGNRGDAPHLHHYSQWMKGVVAYQFPQDVDIHSLATAIARGREEARRRREVQDKHIRSVKGIAKAKRVARANKRK